MVLESVLVSFFYKWLTSFPSTTSQRDCFNPLHIFASFAKDKVSIGVWIYLWALPYCLDDCGFVVKPQVRQVDSSSSILLSQDFFVYLRFFCISIQIVKLFVLVL